MAAKKTITVSADEGSITQVRPFVEETLEKCRVSADNASELKMVFEALFHEIVSQAGNKDTEVEIRSVNKSGHADIVFLYSGKRFLLGEGGASANAEAKTLEEFSDKVSCSYRGGHNVIKVAVKKSAWTIVLPSLTAVIAALIVGFVLDLVVDDAGRQMLVTELIAPLEKLFTNAILMIGAPMTLFSLLKNVTNSFIVAERHSSTRKLFVIAVASSLSVIALALVMGFVFAQWILFESGVTQRFDLGFASWSLASAVDEIIPSSIIQPFETISPIPMIAVALFVVGALFSIGKNFDVMKRAIDACYDLFSGILQLLMTAFPLACFLLFLGVLLANDGVEFFVEIFFIGIIVFVSTIPFLILYALRLKARGVHVRQFAKTIWPLVKENFVMGSVIDAVPYNTRYCAKHLGIPRDRLEKELPILAQTSLDGNCFILMLLATIYIFIANCEVSWFNIAVIALIVVFLSFGAPNQPGSILIGMLVILTYLHSDTAISLALCFELFCGGLQNILNVISSVVTVAENECREGKRGLEMT